MSTSVKIVVAVVILIYVISPIDLCPGPIDDVIVALIGIASVKGAKSAE